MFIKNLLPGQSFTADFTHGTVYVTDGKTVGDSLTTIYYHIVSQYADEGVKPHRGMFTKPSLVGVTVI